MSKVIFKSISDMEQYVKDSALIRNAIFRELGDYLRFQRQQRQLSVSQVAQDTGIATGAINVVESGSSRIRFAVVARLLRYYESWVEVKFVPMPEEMKGN